MVLLMSLQVVRWQALECPPLVQKVPLGLYSKSGPRPLHPFPSWMVLLAPQAPSSLKVHSVDQMVLTIWQKTVPPHFAVPSCHPCLMMAR